MKNVIIAGTTAAAAVAFGKNIPLVGNKPIVKVAIGAGTLLLTRKMDGALGAAVHGAAIGLAIDGVLDFVPGLRGA